MTKITQRLPKPREALDEILCFQQEIILEPKKILRDTKIETDLHEFKDKTKIL